MNRRVRVLAAAVALLPSAVALAVVRPALAGLAPEEGRYGLTFEGTAATTAGDAGAGGGLVVFDTAAPAVTGRLDSGPSAAATAAVVEPGTLARTVAGQVNSEAGEQVVDLPLAAASSPGTEHAAYSVSEPIAPGPVLVAAGRASADATPDGASGEARVDGVVLSTTGDAATDDEPLVRMGGASAEGEASASQRGTVLLARSATQVSRIVVAGLLELADVSATAEVTLRDGKRVASASLTIGSAALNGTPVVIDTHGVRAAETDLPTDPLAPVTGPIESTLLAAGITVELTAPTETVAGRTAFADSGGVRITVATPATPAVPGNSLSIIVGRTTTTLADDPPSAAPPVAPPGQVAPVLPPGEAADGTPVTTSPAAPPPTADGPPAVEPRLAVAGVELPVALVVAAFGVWQLLSLCIATLAAISDRRPGAHLAG